MSRIDVVAGPSAISLRGDGLLRKHLSDASDLRADGLELFFDMFVAAIDVVDAVDDCLAIGYQRR